MSEFVRVRDPLSGHEYTLRPEQVQEGHVVLDKPAIGRDGLPRPPKYRVPLGAPRAESSQMDNPPHSPVTTPMKTAKSAGSEKEN